MSTRLDGIRVLDLTHGAFSYASTLLAGVGAEIVEVGRTVDQKQRSRWTKLGPTPTERLGDLEHPDFAATLRKADVVCESLPIDALESRGLGYESLARENRALIWASITPFGLTGPRRAWKATNLTSWAISGLMPSVGDPDRAPLAPGGHLPLNDMLAALHATTGILLAIRARRKSGRGQRIDIAEHATAVAAACELGVNVFLDDLLTRRRAGNRRRQLSPSGHFKCKDGYAAVMILPVAHWDAIARWIHEKTGNEVVLDPMFRDLGTRVETYELLEPCVEELAKLYTKQELFEEGQRRGICITPVNTLTDLLTDPQLEARGWWRKGETQDGAKIAGPGFRFRKSD